MSILTEGGAMPGVGAIHIDEIEPTLDSLEKILGIKLHYGKDHLPASTPSDNRQNTYLRNACVTWCARLLGRTLWESCPGMAF